MKLPIIGYRSPIYAVAIFVLTVGTVMADLEWITGGVPKSSEEKAQGAVVTDAPGGEGLPTLGNQEIVVGHLTTCTRVVNQYPIDSVNFFFQGKHNQVGYFAYFLAKPSSRIHTAVAECFSSAGAKLARYEREFKVSFIDNLLTIKNETYQWFLLDLTLGMDRVRPESGQTALIREPGLYTIHLTVDGQLVGITFFYVKPPESKAPSAAPTGIPSSKAPALPLSTPISSQPIRPPAK